MYIDPITGALQSISATLDKGLAIKEQYRISGDLDARFDVVKLKALIIPHCTWVRLLIAKDGAYFSKQ